MIVSFLFRFVFLVDFDVKRTGVCPFAMETNTLVLLSLR